MGYDMIHLSQQLKTARILIVDDQQENLEVSKYYLNRAGYENIQVTDSPHDAIGLLRNKVFDIILLDLMMPDIDGFDVLKYSSSFRSNSGPIIVVTARSDDDTKIKALKIIGVRDYISKPFLESELLLRVRNLLEMHIAQCQLKVQNQNMDKILKEQNKDLIDRNIQLREHNVDMLERIGLAAEFRDNETGFHVTRMSKYSQALGVKIGLKSFDTDLLLMTAPMHDVGKIGVPDSVLLKPGKLTPDEWCIMQKHPAIGARILSNRPSRIRSARRHSILIETGRLIALTHHERWDGKGYPRKIAGSDIPLFSRIVTIADVFDALTSDRPYKSAWTIDKTITTLKEGRETQFDPNILDAFIDDLPTILAIKQLYQDGEEL